VDPSPSNPGDPSTPPSTPDDPRAGFGADSGGCAVAGDGATTALALVLLLGLCLQRRRRAR